MGVYREKVVTGDAELKILKSKVVKVVSVKDLGRVTEDEVNTPMIWQRIYLYISIFLILFFLPIIVIGYFVGTQSIADFSRGMVMILVGIVVTIFSLITVAESFNSIRRIRATIGQPKYKVRYVPMRAPPTYVPSGVTSHSSSSHSSSESDYEKRRLEREIRARERYKRAYSPSGPHRRRGYP